MIKPLSGPKVNFTGSLEDYQQQIKSKKEPKYQLTLSAGNDCPPAQKPTFKQGVAGIFKGFNNITGLIGGIAKGAVKGVAFGALAGVVAKNFKQNTSTIIKENGKTSKALAFGGFIKDTIGDLWGFVGKALTGIGQAFQKAPIDALKDVASLPKKYMNYLGKGNKAAKAIAIGVGVTTLVASVLEAKVHANRKNADVDHSLNLSH